jgi:hypothetical protein
MGFVVDKFPAQRLVVADHANKEGVVFKMRALRLITVATIIVGNMSPVAAQHDIITIAQLERGPELNCATKLKGLIIDIDELLAKNPRDLTDVYAVFHRHFPVNGCNVDEVSLVVKASKYFRSISMNGPNMHAFSFNSETASSRGVAASFGLTDTGELVFPFAIWSTPFL